MAHLSCLPGLTIPQEVIGTLERRGLRFTYGEPAGVEAGGPMEFPLIWVGDRWDEAVQLVSELRSRVARERTIAIGHEPPRDIGPRLRATGALTYAKADIPEWLLPSIARALSRLKEGQAVQWWPRVRDHTESIPNRAVETLLTLTRVARDLLGANEANILVRKHPDSNVCVLQQDQGSTLLLAWDQVGIPDPTPFFDAAERCGGQVVLPCIDHAVSLAHDPRVAQSLGGAIATVFHAGQHWRSSILLRWKDPFLPNPYEIAALESLSWVAAATWTHLTLLTRPLIEPHVKFVRRASESKQRLAPERALLHTAAELACASAALLFLRDSEEPPDRLYFACEWHEEPTSSATSHIPHIDCPEDPNDWPGAIETLLGKSGLSHFHASILQLPPEKDRLPAGAVVLLLRRESRNHRSALMEDLNEQAAAEFIEYAWPLHASLKRQQAQDAVDHLSPSSDLRELLNHAAAVLRETAGADQVYAQYGPETVGAPRSGKGIDIAVGGLSITGIARKQNGSLRILDLEDSARELPTRQNAKGKAALLADLEWTGLQSMIVCPIDHGRGVIKAYTRARGAYLTPADDQLITLVAERLAKFAAPIHDRAALQALNALMAELVTLSGKALATQLIARFEAWADRFLHRGSALFVVARNGTTPFLTGESERDDVPTLGELLQQERDVALGSWKVSREPFSLAGGHGVSGVLFLLCNGVLSDSSRILYREAAREVAVLLHAESARHELYQQQGILRHGLLGPAQGLTSNALYLARELEQRKISSAEILAATATIRRDADRMRMWRGENRLVAGLQWQGRLEVRRRRGELRPLVLSCVDRFRTPAAERNLSIGVDLPLGGMFATFDEEALDMALSNLLDNAIKYAFYNREVVVGVKMFKRSVALWVEDVGHGIPDELRDAIYEPGQRVGQHDPFRVIRGEGLGLFLVRKIAEAHGGSLSHTCQLEGRAANERAPYRVRFTLELGGN